MAISYKAVPDYDNSGAMTGAITVVAINDDTGQELGLAEVTGGSYPIAETTETKGYGLKPGTLNLGYANNVTFTVSPDAATSFVQGSGNFTITAPIVSASDLAVSIAPGAVISWPPTMERKPYGEVRNYRIEQAMSELTATQRADLADAAADKLEADGWVQGSYFSNQASCAVGALRRAAADMNLVDSPHSMCQGQVAILGVAAMVADMLGVMSLQSWNDSSGRTAEEVIDVLRDYAIKTRPDEAPGLER